MRPGEGWSPELLLMIIKGYPCFGIRRPRDGVGQRGRAMDAKYMGQPTVFIQLLSAVLSGGRSPSGRGLCLVRRVARMSFIGRKSCKGWIDEGSKSWRS